MLPLPYDDIAKSSTGGCRSALEDNTNSCFSWQVGDRQALTSLLYDLHSDSPAFYK